MGTQEVYSDQVLENIDSEVKRIVTGGYDNAVRILKENREILNEMAESLLIREVLESRDINAIMSGEKIITEDEIRAYEKRKASTASENLAEEASSENSESGSVNNENKNSGGIEPVPQGT